MLNSLNKNQLYASIAISCVFFIILNFIIGPTSVFGLADFILNKTGYFFGIDINTLDYLLIALFPVFGLLLNSKRKGNSFKEIFKDYLIILLCCLITFSIGLFILITKIGSPSANPLIPEYLRVEPFKIYSTFFIGIGIILPFFSIKKYVQETENIIEEIGKENSKFSERKFEQKEYEEIIVDLIKTKIKSEKWNEIEVKNESLEYYLNSLSDTGGNENLRFIKKKINNIIIQIPYKKSFIDYEIKTEMETTKLKLFFEVQKETKAQVDKTNRKIKYIDLSFLR